MCLGLILIWSEPWIWISPDHPSMPACRGAAMVHKGHWRAGSSIKLSQAFPLQKLRSAFEFNICFFSCSTDIILGCKPKCQILGITHYEKMAKVSVMLDLFWKTQAPGFGYIFEFCRQNLVQIIDFSRTWIKRFVLILNAALWVEVVIWINH